MLTNLFLFFFFCRCNAFALFLKNQRRWVSPALKPADITAFHEFCKKYNYNPRTEILPHGSYLINLGNPDAAKREQARDAFIDDLRRCEQLGIGLYNLHPGSSLGSDKQETLQRIADGINDAIKETEFVKVVLENMAGHGHIVGSQLEDLAQIIELVQDKARVGVCIDTCHAFAAGFDLRESTKFTAFWADFDRIVGYKYLAAIHLNDSKAPLGSKRDLHQNIGLGFLGLEAFRLIVNKPELEGLPMVLETPEDAKLGHDVRGDEIKLLEWLVGKDADDEEVLAKSKALQAKGAKERAEHQKKYNDKLEKEERPKKRQRKLFE